MTSSHRPQLNVASTHHFHGQCCILSSRQSPPCPKREARSSPSFCESLVEPSASKSCLTIQLPPHSSRKQPQLPPQPLRKHRTPRPQLLPHPPAEPPPRPPDPAPALPPYSPP